MLYTCFCPKYKYVLKWIHKWLIIVKFAKTDKTLISIILE